MNVSMFVFIHLFHNNKIINCRYVALERNFDVFQSHAASSIGGPQIDFDWIALTAFQSKCSLSLARSLCLNSENARHNHSISLIYIVTAVAARSTLIYFKKKKWHFVLSSRTVLRCTIYSLIFFLFLILFISCSIRAFPLHCISHSETRECSRMVRGHHHTHWHLHV